MITQELSKEYFTYKDGELFHNRNVSSVKQGAKAGSLNSKGYVNVGMNGKIYQAHRVIFIMHHGYLPKHIDHIDGNKSNNKIGNLRECTHSENQWNRKVDKRNTSGVKGVSWHKATNSWKVAVCTNGIIKHVGLFKAIDDAKKAAEKYRKEMHGAFVHNG